MNDLHMATFAAGNGAGAKTPARDFRQIKANTPAFAESAPAPDPGWISGGLMMAAAALLAFKDVDTALPKASE